MRATVLWLTLAVSCRANSHMQGWTATVPSRAVAFVKVRVLAGKICFDIWLISD